MTYESTVNRASTLLAGLLAAAICASCGVGAEVVRKAAGVGTNAGELDRFVRACDALVTPATIAMVAVAPLACLVGAGMLMFGSRRGAVIIGAALGTLVLVASIKGIVA